MTTHSEAKRIVEGLNRDLPEPFWLELTPRDDLGHNWFLVFDANTGWSGGAVSVVDDDFLWILRTAQALYIEHEFGEAWPRCVIHGSHPLVPATDGWRCPDLIEASPIWPYGSLSQYVPPPEPERRDAEVRWYVDDLRCGVIATDTGDCFMDKTAIERTPDIVLQEGELVEYEAERTSEGPFPLRATRVSPID